MIIYVDGSAHPNPGPGGYGLVVCDDNLNILKKISKQFKGPVTNNQMELKAVLHAMVKYGKMRPIPIIYSDSSYCVNTFNSWIFKWKENNWLNSNKKTPENLELLLLYLDLLKQGYKIDLRKTSGHSGIFLNELADGLATGKEKGDN